MCLCFLLSGPQRGYLSLELANVALSGLVVLGLGNFVLEGLDLLFYGCQYNPSSALPDATHAPPRVLETGGVLTLATGERGFFGYHRVVRSGRVPWPM